MSARLTVLVIEDDEAIQAMLESMLELDGYRVLCAYDGLGGLVVPRTGAAPWPTSRS